MKKKISVLVFICTLIFMTVFYGVPYFKNKIYLNSIEKIKINFPQEKCKAVKNGYGGIVCVRVSGSFCSLYKGKYNACGSDCAINDAKTGKHSNVCTDGCTATCYMLNKNI